MPSYSSSLLLKNVFLALTYQLPNFPSTLLDCGYDEVFIEKAFTNSRLQPMQYDMAACAPARNRSILLEFKGGVDAQDANEQQRVANQVARYLAVTGEDVVQKAGFSVAPGLDPLQHATQTLIVGVDRQMDGIGNAIPSFKSLPSFSLLPLLAARIDTTTLKYGGIKRIRGSCDDDELDKRVDEPVLPSNIPLTLTFDLDSRAMDIAEAIMPAVLQMFYRLPQNDTFELRDVLQQAISLWPLIDSREQDAYTTRVRGVLNDLVAHEFRGWFEWDNKVRKWRILQPLPTVAADRMRAFRRLQRLQHQALMRLGGGELQQQALQFDAAESDV